MNLTVRCLFGGGGRFVVLLSVFLTLLLQGCAVSTLPSDSPGTPVIGLQTDSNREVDLRAWLPASCDPCNAIIFSHGHSLSFNQYDTLLSRWAEAGYLVLAPLHIDSELHRDRHKFQAEEYINLRLQDMETVVTWLASGKASAHFDLNLSARYLAAGHSFGALVAQMAGGATVIRNDATLKLELDRRPTGIIAISPPGPVPDYLSAQGWSHIDVHHLVVTGTADVVPMFAPAWEAHLASFRAGPVGKSYALTFTGMDHYFNGAFGRLKAVDTDSTIAVDILNRGILQFADALNADIPLSAEVWSGLSSERVLAETR